MGIGNLANIFRNLDLRLDRAVLTLHRSQLIDTAENRFALGRYQTLTDTEHIDLGTLTQNILNNVLIQ